MNKTDVIVVGAGASGLMAALELAKAGKKVVILEARDRIGGRIWPLPEQEFGYPAQGGAEFVHGEAVITKQLVKEAGLTLLPTDGEVWSLRAGVLAKGAGGIMNNPEFVAHRTVIRKRLKEIEEDMPITVFLEKYFSEEKYAALRHLITKIVEGYDAADPNKISTIALREEWLGAEAWQEDKIKEGYGALVDFLVAKCREKGVEIILDWEVASVDLNQGGVRVISRTGEKYEADRVIVTASLTTISRIHFRPAIPGKIAATEKMGFGDVVKFILRFKSEWWINTLGQDFSKMIFMLTNERVATWWTQHPESLPVLTGWIPGPAATDLKGASSEEITELGLSSLVEIFKVKKDFLKEQLVSSRVFNWPADPFSRGAYSYATPETKEAREELIKPVNGRIFFAGEALYAGKDVATVEGALASGRETALIVLKSE